MSRKKVAVVKKQAMLLSQNAEKEYDDLEYIVNKISTSVDFIASQVAQTIDQWKAGKIYRRSSLDDLKFKFRLDTFSIDDGWGLFYSYPDWIHRQREKILVLIEFLGTEPESKEESIESMIERAEKKEWANGLEMDMDVIFILREMRKVLQLTRAMEPKLKDLEAACKKRTSQIVEPSWEPRKRW